MNETLLRFNKKQKYLVFDTETEGLNLVSSKPWQIAWLVAEGDRIISKHDLYIDWPDLNVSPDAARVTGFSQASYRKKCKPPEEVWGLFAKDFYDPNTLLVGQNVLGFDVYMLNVWRHLMRQKVDYDYVSRIIDTRALATAIAKQIPVDNEDFISWQYRLVNYKERGLKTSQGFLLKKYNIPHDAKRLHDALYDIEMNFKIFRKQLFELDI